MITKRKALSTLRKARSLIADPAHWCQGAYSRNADGTPPDFKTALRGHKGQTSYCAVGCIICACEEMNRDDGEYYNLLSLIVKLNDLTSTGAYSNTITRFNDFSERKHLEVLELFDNAIERIEEEGV